LGEGCAAGGGVWVADGLLGAVGLWARAGPAHKARTATADVTNPGRGVAGFMAFLR
jgi:hypothetical protein